MAELFESVSNLGGSHAPLPPPSRSSSKNFRRLSVCRFHLFIIGFVFIFVSVGALLLLSYPLFVVQPFLVRQHDVFPVPLVQLLEHKEFNKDLLDMARSDAEDPGERNQINNILNETWHPASRRSYPFHRDHLLDHHDYRDRFWDGRKYRAREQRMPLQLSSPKFLPYWRLFRGLLQSWLLNKRHEPLVMKELLHLVKDPIDRHYMKKSNSTWEPGKPYKTCAVVGNSGILLNQSYAALIDSHDMVMRLNNARITHFERHVGSKTTLSFVNSNILHNCARQSGCFCHPYGADVPLIMYICQVVHFMDVAYCGSSHPAPIIVTDARFDILCAHIAKYYSLKGFVERTGRRPGEWNSLHDGPLFHYSSGMQAVLLAVGICNEVSLFGFGKSNNTKHHYHTNQKVELRLHDYPAEYQFYVDLAVRDSSNIPFLNEAGFAIPPVHIYW